MDLWTFLARCADFAGIISFFISIGTFFIAIRIRKKMLVRVARTEYIEKIDEYIKNLNSYCESMQIDKAFNTRALDIIDTALSDILIHYSTILPKDILSSIKKLRKYIAEHYQSILNDNSAKRNCEKQLHAIAEQLGQEKKII